MLAPDLHCLDELDALLKRQDHRCWQRIRKKFDDAEFCARAPLGVINCYVELETGPRCTTRAKVARLRATVDWLQRLPEPPTPPAPNPPELPNPPAPRSLATNSSTTSSAT